uniref:Phosphonopyruvate decarboxylase n=1 Tax=Candidatus Kentrum sp. MB TaxID=2138164 RepID=A0A450XTQ1_9GAMM|nr:MAG: phosphonopyruvate decarboxylase [Candidatus Kentron sp. MB]VFK35532.1 MAG: phosphonopyruvate decarboxylase [Candidatus Kentron sp. MB]VFK77334.1 MAG: phosphonopyruvate decarboxylase [Candidatus Kentron sp. MB]
MISAEHFIDLAAERGFTLYSGVPCSYLKPLINCVITNNRIRYIPAANEGDAVAITAGAELGGLRGVAMMQNSGLGNAVNPLTSLTHTLRIPVLLIITLRGEVGGPADEPQHGLMGPITTNMLELMRIPWAYFPTEEVESGPILDRAVNYMDKENRPYALVMKKGSVHAWPAPPPLPIRTLQHQAIPLMMEPTVHRHDILAILQQHSRSSDVLLATTGYTGRELFALDDRKNQLYMVGSMGCISSLALGLALAQPQRRVIAIDGDGSLIMRMGTLATIGHQRPDNLLHLMLDNTCYESTGGQHTVSGSLDFCSIAGACGYPYIHRSNRPEQLAGFLQTHTGGLSMVHIPILPGTLETLPRPDVTPSQVARRLRDYLAVHP